jgi:flagellar assembly protein FliH
MSTDTAFTVLTFPSLRGDERDDSAVRARASGHAAGYAAGLRAADLELKGRLAELDAEREAMARHVQARLDRSVELLAAAARALAARTTPVLAEAQDAVAASAIALAEAIVGVELSDIETSARSAMTRALAEVDLSLVQSVRMNPLDLEVLDPSAVAATGVVFTADSTITRGDAITEFPVGFLDARIETATARARAAILGEKR